jgi:hypothetical protein
MRAVIFLNAFENSAFGKTFLKKPTFFKKPIFFKKAIFFRRLSLAAFWLAISCLAMWSSAPATPAASGRC